MKYLRKRVRRKLIFIGIAVASFLMMGTASAVSLGKIEVASYLGEPFVAVIPLKLDSNELVSKVFVEIASKSDYRIFEVYRDQVLSSIRADVASGSHGSRIELSSRNGLKSPFFNLVLKIRYGRVTHFKKFPVFLEQPKSIQTIAEKKPLPTVKAILPAGATQPPVVSKAKAPKAKAGTAPVLKLYDGWARTGRYGPIVRGDSLSTVAERLRVDYRYTRNQIMAALFEKNRSKFDQDNMNLLKAGSYLDVPKAAEVMRLSKKQALGVLADHEKRWKQLTKQPRYAAEKVAQKTRYIKRVRVGKQADGVASAAMTPQAAKKATLKPKAPSPAVKPVETASVEQTRPKAAMPIAVDKPDVPEQAKEPAILATEKTTTTEATQSVEDQATNSLLITGLKKENSDLKQQMEENEKFLNLKITDLQQRMKENERLLIRKIDSASELAKEASNAAMAKLEVLVAQLQGQLQEAQREAQSLNGASRDWIIWLLSGLIAILFGVVALLVRREPVHPAIADSHKPDAGVAVPETDSASVTVAEKQEDVTFKPEGKVEADREKRSFSATIPDLTDELTDTDTAEMEPFDATLVDNPDSNVDYLSEAEVYIRYGMEDEALQQVNMALRLQPDNVEAHIKKVEVLRSSSNSEGLTAAVAAAGGVLSGFALERFSSAVADIKDREMPTEIFGSGGDEITEDLTDRIAENAKTFAEPDHADVTLDGELETADVNFDLANVDHAGEMDWLEDVPLAGDDFSTSEIAVEQENETPAQIENTVDMDVGGATQELGTLLSGFADDEEEIGLDATGDAFDPSIFDEPAQPSGDPQDATFGMDTDHGATQELDNLLSEFASEEEQGTMDHIDLPDIISADKTVEMDGGEATQELDNLLSEFSGHGDVELALGETVEGLDESLFKELEPPKTATEQEIAGDVDHGATQELDNLLGEFQEGTGELEPLNDQLDSTIELDVGSGATQKLNNLLSEFSDADISLEGTIEGLDGSVFENIANTPEDMNDKTIALDADQLATQELDNLLSEFSDDDRDEKKE